MKRERKVTMQCQNRVEYSDFLDLFSAFEHDKFPDGKDVVNIDKYGGIITITLISTKES